jgi:thymidylate kinase
LSHIIYVTGVRGIGKTTLVEEVRAWLTRSSVKTLVLPEWTEPPRSKISYREFAEWLITQRVQRDKILRQQTKVDLTICDRSPVCPLVFALANLSERDWREVEDAYRQHSFAKGIYLHMRASPEIIYSRLRSRNDSLWSGSLSQIKSKIERTENAYRVIFEQEEIQPVIMNTDQLTIKQAVDKFVGYVTRLIS